MAKTSVPHDPKPDIRQAFHSLEKSDRQKLRSAEVTLAKLLRLRAQYDQRKANPTQMRRVVEFFEKLPANGGIRPLAHRIIGIKSRDTRVNAYITLIPEDLFDEWAGRGLTLSDLRAIGQAWKNLKEPSRAQGEASIKETVGRALDESWTASRLKQELFPSRDDKATRLQTSFVALANALAAFADQETQARLRSVAQAYKYGRGRNFNPLSVEQRATLVSAILNAAALSEPKPARGQ